MDKKLTVIEAAKLLGVSKEAIYNRLRRGSLQSVIEEGVKYILLPKGNFKESSNSHRKLEAVANDSAYVDLLKAQLEELKLKNEKLEADKERLIADKERMLIESKEKIEMIYKERDEQLKAILSLANRQISHAPNTNQEHEIVQPTNSVETSYFEEADVLDEEIKESDDELEGYSDWRDLRSYLKEKGFSKKEKQHISNSIEKKLEHLDNVMDKNGKLFIRKGKKLKEILGD